MLAENATAAAKPAAAVTPPKTTPAKTTPAKTTPPKTTNACSGRKWGCFHTHLLLHTLLRVHTAHPTFHAHGRMQQCAKVLTAVQEGMVTIAHMMSSPAAHPCSAQEDVRQGVREHLHRHKELRQVWEQAGGPEQGVRHRQVVYLASGLQTVPQNP